MAIIKSGSMGDIVAQDIRQLAIDIHIDNPAGMASEVTEVLLRINGRVISRMHPERARRLGLVHHSDRDIWTNRMAPG